MVEACGGSWRSQHMGCGLGEMHRTGRWGVKLDRGDEAESVALTELGYGKPFQYIFYY